MEENINNKLDPSVIKTLEETNSYILNNIFNIAANVIDKIITIDSKNDNILELGNNLDLNSKIELINDAIATSIIKRLKYRFYF